MNKNQDHQDHQLCFVIVLVRAPQLLVSLQFLPLLGYRQVNNRSVQRIEWMMYWRDICNPIRDCPSCIVFTNVSCVLYGHLAFSAPYRGTVHIEGVYNQLVSVHFHNRPTAIVADKIDVD